MERGTSLHTWLRCGKLQGDSLAGDVETGKYLDSSCTYGLGELRTGRLRKSDALSKEVPSRNLKVGLHYWGF
jgi:hypothetical protein